MKDSCSFDVDDPGLKDAYHTAQRSVAVRPGRLSRRPRQAGSQNRGRRTHAQLHAVLLPRHFPADEYDLECAGLSVEPVLTHGRVDAAATTPLAVREQVPNTAESNTAGYR
jgi:hypothetical protein